MAAMVMTMPQVSLPTSNGTEEKTPGGGFHIDISGLEEEAYEDACNQVDPNSQLNFRVHFGSVILPPTRRRA